jgi:hypothetical protein
MRRHHVLLLALACASCGLLDRVAPVTFRLPRKTFVLDTEESQWRKTPQAFAAPVDCTSREDCCMPAGGPALSCTEFPFVCVAGSCAIEYPVELVVPVNLGHDAPELAPVRARVPAAITLEDLAYTVSSQLNVALPEVIIAVAPRDVASASSPDAHRLGVVPLTNAQLQNGSGTIVLTAEARRAFEALARDLQTPFNLIASTTIVVRSGSPAPMGRVDLTITGRVSATF